MIARTVRRARSHGIALPGLGPTIRARLAQIGVTTVAELGRVRPATLYRRLVTHSGQRLPVCYYLYTLEAARRGIPWRALSDREKTALRREAGV
ncbi:MAG: TfoX/Sxy family DNA transformation protein [Kofleriaceae bacterium]